MQHKSSSKDATQHTEKTNKWKEIYDSDALKEEIESGEIAQDSSEEALSSMVEKADPLETDSDNKLTYDALLNRFRAEEERAEKAEKNAKRLQYLVAELQTTQRLTAQREKFSIEKQLKEVLPVMDSLDNCKASLKADTNLETLKEGVELILKLMSEVFTHWGIVPIQPSVGDVFDPNCHIAMSVKEEQEQASGAILETLQKGYYLYDRVIRPAMVVVNK